MTPPTVAIPADLLPLIGRLCGCHDLPCRCDQDESGRMCLPCVSGKVLGVLSSPPIWDWRDEWTRLDNAKLQQEATVCFDPPPICP